MSKNALPLLTGGLNEVTRSDIIDNTELQVCDNYEVTGDGVLSKRGGVEEYDSELNTFLGTIFDSIISISQPFYSSNIIKNLKSEYSYLGDQTNEFILLVYGIKSSVYEMHMLYQNSSGWTNEYEGNTLNFLLSEDSVLYTQNSTLEFTLGQDKIIITDNVNRAHYFSVSSEGSVLARTLGIPAPMQKPSLAQSKLEGVFSISSFTETSTDQRLSTPGYIQVTYTIVSKTGEESNPSPLSDSLDFSIHQFDVDSNRSMWVDKVIVSNLALPNISKRFAEELDSFNIYIKVLPYKSSLSVDTLELSQNFKINQRFDENGDVLFSGDTGNTYSLVIEPTGQGISYENDKAPIAKTAAFIGGVTMLGNLSSPIEFPFDFKYFHPITLSNINASNYVDSVICITISETDIGPDNEFKLIDYFNISNAVDDNGDEVQPWVHIKLEALRCLRFYDSDLTTPLHSYFAGSTVAGSPKGNVVTANLDPTSPSDDNWFRIFVKIPSLTAGQSKNIYFCWSPIDDDSLGVPSNLSTTDTGRIQQSWDAFYDVEGIGAGPYFQDNTVWNMESAMGPDENSLATLNFENTEGDDTFLFNKANRSNPGYDPDAQIVASTYWDDVGLRYQPSTPHVHSFLTSFLVNDSYAMGNNYLLSDEHLGQETYFINTDSALHFESFYCTFALSVTENDFVNESGYIQFFSLASSANLAIKMFFDEGNFSFQIKDGDNYSIWDLNEVDGGVDLGDLLTHNTGSWNDGTRTNIFVCISMDGGYSSVDAKLSMFFYPLDNANPNFRKIKSFEKLLTADTIDQGGASSYNNLFSSNLSGVKYAGIGTVGPEASDDGGFESPGIDSVNFVQNTYLSASDSSDKEMVWNIFNNQSPFKHTIGMNYDFNNNVETFNNNIFFNTTKNILEEKFRNMVRWSDVGSDAIPDLFFKKIQEPVIKVIDAPSFLQYQYQNTFLIFSRNSIHRFILEAKASGWSGDASSLIQEKTQYGLLAPKSLVRVAEGLFWLSETGVVKWDSKGFVLISKNRVKVPIDETSIGFYNSLKNQYILYNNTIDDTGVFRYAYVYHIDRDLWTRFKFQGQDLGLETNMESILSTAVLTGGSELDNVNLFLVKNGDGNGYSINKYPSENPTILNSQVKTKDMFFEKGVLKRVQLNHKEGSTLTVFQSNVTKNDKDGNEIVKTNTISQIENGKWRGVSNANSRGKSVNFEVENADEIESILYDINLQGKVKQ